VACCVEHYGIGYMLAARSFGRDRLDLMKTSNSEARRRFVIMPLSDNHISGAYRKLPSAHCGDLVDTVVAYVFHLAAEDRYIVR
jgi:hypothetical protein